MSLKHLRENYARLLNAFKDAGINLTESQKKDIDGFMVALESTMEQTKASTIKATRKVVEREMEKEYKKVFESILTHKAEHDELAGKIQRRVNKINESKKIAKDVDNYLDVVLKESLPNNTIVDTIRLKKLESIFESLKDTLLVNDASIEAKRQELTESFENDRKDLEKKVADLEKRLNKSITNEKKLTRVIESKKAKDLLEKKTKDLPLFESNQIKKRLANATCEEIEKNFKPLLESVREEMADACKEEEKTLEEEIADIIAKEGCDTSSNKKDVAKVPVQEKKDEDADEDDDAKSDDEDEGDDVELDESEMIPSYLMKAWIARSSEIKPIG